MNNPDEKPAKVIGTLVYLRRTNGGVQEIVLSIKGDTPKALKRGLAGKYNSYGGGFEYKDASLAHCGAREVLEESGVVVKPESLEKIAVIVFHNPWGDYECHYFVVDDNGADPRATKEMLNPRWFPINNLPFEKMMESDKLLLPRLLSTDPIERKLIFGWIKHADKMHIIDYDIDIVQKLL